MGVGVWPCQGQLETIAPLGMGYKGEATPLSMRALGPKTDLREVGVHPVKASVKLKL